jgi:hypothetical protein
VNPEQKNPNSKFFIGAVIVESLIIVWGITSSSSQNYGTPILFSFSIIIFWLPATLVSWWLNNRDNKKQIESGRSVAGLKTNWKTVLLVLMLWGAISIIYALCIDNHNRHCSGLDSFPNSLTCHFK